MTRIEAVVSDFGGVLTVPLLDSFLDYERQSGISPEALGKAMGAITTREGANPMFELERGAITADAFLDALERELSAQRGETVSMRGFSDHYFANLHPNDAMIDYMRGLKIRGYKLAVCTNNVREWQPLWRPRMPIDEIFDVVIDSGFVGFRKPDPEIYELTLTGLGVSAPEALLLDDFEVNCTAARELGMSAVQFHSTDQAIAEIEMALAV